MAIRNVLEEHGKFILPALVLVAGLMVWRGVMSGSSSSSILQRDKWMFDLNTGLLVRSAVSTVAPGDTESGPFTYPKLGEAGAPVDAGALVDAFVYTCGDPGAVRDGMSREEMAAVDAHLVYVVMTDPRARAADLNDDEALPAPLLVSAPDGDRWVGQFSRPGKSLQNRVADLCGGPLPTEARP